MPITEAQKTDRSRYTYSSEGSALIGCHPRGLSMVDLWLAKTGQLEAEDERFNESAFGGNLLEHALLEFLQHLHGPIKRNQYRSNPAAMIAAHWDAEIQRDKSPGECKSCSRWGGQADQWGADGTDEVADHCMVQCHMHMIAGAENSTDPKDGPQECQVVAVVGDVHDFRSYVVKKDYDLTRLILERNHHLWECIRSGTRPVGAISSVDVAKRVRRLTGKIAPLDPRAVASYQYARERRLAFEKAEEAALLDMLDQLGDAEIGEYGSDTLVFTYKRQKGPWRFDQKLMAEDGVLDKYGSQGDFPVARIQKRR